MGIFHTASATSFYGKLREKTIGVQRGAVEELRVVGVGADFSQQVSGKRTMRVEYRAAVVAESVSLQGLFDNCSGCLRIHGRGEAFLDVERDPKGPKERKESDCIKVCTG